MSLATVLRLNAVSCLGFGLLFLFAPGVTAGFLGTPPVWLLVALGAGLIGNGILLWLSQHRGRAPRRHEVLFFSIGDFGWVAMTVVLIASGFWIVTPEGRIAALLVAAGVGAMGVLQWRGLPRSEAPHS
ncbi:hypothetical protein SAMN05443999_101391 [Roseovarius azorensis]|uniref:SPW repeat-containing protein n=1 Tax=Roseovarius azorensis TaxID=1287727 RepID=A0A1H7GV62_9RHOB|nr:hypothetical protein [Roseovarius azorensis]SEK41889.1 hypothetical protein SAMN05443999_101391 [Roseovarius azorensis]